MGSEYFIDKAHGVMCVQESGGITWWSRWVAKQKHSEKMYSDPIFQRARSVLWPHFFGCI